MKRFAQFQLDDSAALVSGAVPTAFAHSIKSQTIIPVLEKYGLADADPQAWYPFENCVAVMKDLSRSTEDLVSMGMSMAEEGNFPEEFLSLPFDEKIRFIVQGHGWSHQGEVGGYVIHQDKPGHIILDVNTPYPDDLIYGFYWGLARKYRPEGRQFVVKYDDKEAPRSRGGQITYLHIMWN